MHLKYWLSCLLLVISNLLKDTRAGDNDYNVLHRDGSYQFGYDTPDSYHYADANRNNIVKGEFGGRNPGTGRIDSTLYTAGPRGFRPRGRNVVRKYDLNQSGRRPLGSPDDPYFDPLEDPSYSFSFRTRTYNRQEDANRLGDVNGKYSYIDDVGERHNVEFIAGKNTGFHVKTPFPDSNPRAYGPLYFNGRGKPIPRGRTSIQRGLDGSYRFVSAGPDQRRTEISDATGHVRGSYTYLDDKGVQHSVHYIAGPETGYRVLKNVKGPHLPTIFPFGRPGIIPPDFYDYGGSKEGDLFDTAASGPIRPVGGSGGGVNKDGGSRPKQPKVDVPFFDNGIDVSKEDFDKFSNDLGRPGGGVVPGGRISTTTQRTEGADSFGNKPFGLGTSVNRGEGGYFKPVYDETGSGSSIEDDLFGDFGIVSSPKPTGVYVKPTQDESDDGSYRPEGEDGSYKPGGEGGYQPNGGGGAGSPTRPSTTVQPSSYGEGGEGHTSESAHGAYGDKFGSRPSQGPSGRPIQRPSNGHRPVGKPAAGTNIGEEDYGESDEFSFGLFGSESGARPSRPTIQIGIDRNVSPAQSDRSCPKCTPTLVRNLGDTLFSLPPGGAIRAHVQAIDLLPVVSKVPSPSEQYKADSETKTEQLNEASSDVKNSTSYEQVATTTEQDAITNTTPSIPTNETTITTAST